MGPFEAYEYNKSKGKEEEKEEESASVDRGLITCASEG